MKLEGIPESYGAQTMPLHDQDAEHGAPRCGVFPAAIWSCFCPIFPQSIPCLTLLNCMVEDPKFLFYLMWAHS